MEELQESKVTQYLIPANVSTRFEFFEGFGWSELGTVIGALLIGLIIFVLLGIPKKTITVNMANMPVEMSIGAKPGEDITTKKVSVISPIIRSFVVIIPGLAAFFLVKKNPANGMSLMYMVKSMKEFKKKQKRYLYKYGSGR